MQKITDSELRCYVCDNLIHVMKRVRTLARRISEDAYHTDKALQLRQKLNLRVIEITGSLERQRRVFRHSHCNPNKKHFTVGDL